MARVRAPPLHRTSTTAFGKGAAVTGGGSSDKRQDGATTSKLSSLAPEDRYRTVVQSIDEGFCVIEMIFDARGRPHDYRFLEINPAFVRQTGIHDAVGRCMRELAPRHEHHWFETYGRVALTGEPARFVHEAQALEKRWFEVYAFRIGSADLRQVAIVFKDISARVRTERNAAFLAGVSQDLVRITDKDRVCGTIGVQIGEYLRLSQCAFVELDVERRAATISGSWHAPDVPSLDGVYRLDEFVTEDLWLTVPETTALAIGDVASDTRVHDRQVFEHNGMRSLVAVPLLLDGRLRQVMVVGRRTAGEWPPVEVDLLREVAARCWVRIESLQAEAELRLSEQRLRLVVESARDYAILAADLERRVTSWNPGAERLLGYSEAEIVGKSGDIIFTPEDVACGVPEAEAGQALRDGRAANERWHLRKDGTRFWGSGVMMSMYDRTGAACGLLKIMRDETAEQEVREALERSRRELMAALEMTEQARAEAVAAGSAKDHFLAALSHELRTPLNPVLLIASEAARDLELPDDVRSDFDMIRRNIELEARLIEDILDISRITQGKLSLRFEPVDLHEVIREAVEIVRPAAEERVIALEVATGTDRAIVQGDPARLKQIVLNLLSNGIKFTPERGRVRIVTELLKARERVAIRVTDTGIGMTADELARVFQPFAQGTHAEGSGSSTFGGLGLGLAIVEELAARHGGVVHASSPGPGHGATFVVELPLARRRGAESGLPRELEGVPAQRILLVEDHAHTRVTLERILRQRHHEVVAVGTRSEAVDRLQRERFDLLVADIGLPDGDGYGLLAEARERHPDIPGIALSGFGMPADLRRSRAAGFAVHLVKPVSASKLVQEIATLLGSRA